jgi:hypothetical protein
VAMLGEYPRDVMELEANFATEEACRAYLARLRWPTGFRCPRCGAEKAWPVRIVHPTPGRLAPSVRTQS